MTQEMNISPALKPASGWMSWYLFVPPANLDLTQCLFYSRDLVEGKVRHEPWQVHWWSVLVIGSGLDAIWTILAIAKSPGTRLCDLAGHRFLRPEGLGQCKCMLVIVAAWQEYQVLDESNSQSGSLDSRSGDPKRTNRLASSTTAEFIYSRNKWTL